MSGYATNQTLDLDCWEIMQGQLLKFRVFVASGNFLAPRPHIIHGTNAQHFRSVIPLFYRQNGEGKTVRRYSDC